MRKTTTHFSVLVVRVLRNLVKEKGAPAVQSMMMMISIEAWNHQFCSIFKC